MTKISILHEPKVQFIHHVGGDRSVLASMLVSTMEDESMEYLRHAVDEAMGDDRATIGRIQYLMRNRHGTPFEHNQFCFFVQAGIFVFREFHRHRIGWCLAGDTKIWCTSTKHKTIEALWDRYHNGELRRDTGTYRFTHETRKVRVRTLDESTGRFVESRIIDVHRNGVKDVLLVATKHGETLRASADHAMWTPDGWRKLGELREGDQLMRQGCEPLHRQHGDSARLRRVIGEWTQAQRVTMIKDVDMCVACGELFNARDLTLDHRVPVAQNIAKALDVTNLQILCRPCHRRKTNDEQVFAKRHGPYLAATPTTIVSIVDGGQCETYDLELEGPMRGFVADGLVVHNSYNESSGRYSQLKPIFYIPGVNRPLVQVGKPGGYTYVPGTDDQYAEVYNTLLHCYEKSYEAYEHLLTLGIAKEVARLVLPVGINSSMYATCNARSLMSFLSLRTHEPEAAYPSHPMYEIEQVARVLEASLEEHMPLTYAAWDKFGRVAP